MAVPRRGHEPAAAYDLARSAQDRANDFAPADGDGAAERVADFGVGVQAQAVEDGGREVLRLDAAGGRVGADGVGRAVDDASLDAAAGQGDGIDVPPVVAAAGGVEL